MRIEYLAEFVQLAQDLNFSVTANKLYTTQSTLSRHIAQLEEEVGERLINRSVRPAELTPAGRILFEKIEPVVCAYQAAMAEVDEALHATSGTLRIAFPYYFADNYLQPELDAFSKRYPNVAITLMPIEPPAAEPLLESGSCDVTFDILYPYSKPNPHFFGRIVATERFCICLSSKHRLASKQIIDAPLLNGQTFIRAAEYAQFNEFLDGFIRTNNLRNIEMIPCGSVELIYSTIIQNNAVSLRIAESGMQPRNGISYVPLATDMTAKIRLVRLEDPQNPLAKLFV